MRFSIITDTFAPEINGVAMTLEKLATGLVIRNHQVDVIHSSHSPDEQSPQKDEAFRYLRVRSLALPKYPQVRVGVPKPFHLKKLWKRKRPDAVYIATEGFLGLSAIRAAGMHGVPVISGYHTHFTDYLSSYRMPLLTNLAIRYLRKIHNDTEMTFVPSRDTATRLSRDGFRNVSVLGRGVDCELFHPDRKDAILRRSWGARDNTIVAFCAGRVATEKNLELALNSVRRVRAGFPDILMVVAGDGPELPALKAKYPEVVWTGVKRGVELAACYASADLFLFPSLSETYGNVLAEAMASGLPSVSFCYAASRELVRHNYNGYSVDFSDESEFTRCVIHAVNDRRQWDEIGENARTLAETKSWDSVIDRFETALVSAAENRLREFLKIQPQTNNDADEKTRNQIQNHLPFRRPSRIPGLQNRAD